MKLALSVVVMIFTLALMYSTCDTKFYRDFAEGSMAYLHCDSRAANALATNMLYTKRPQ